MWPPLLEGTTVLDLSQHVAGPFCTKILAGLGAEVIKVERPGRGDVSRRVDSLGRAVPGPMSDLFLYLNTGKQSVTLNLKAPAGRALLEELLTRADVLVESFAPRTARSLGVTWEALSRVKPNLVMTSLTSHGSRGPYRDYRASYLTVMALSGFPHLMGEPEREPLLTGQYFGLYVAGLTAAVHTVATLFGQRSHGRGCHLEVPVTHAVNWIQLAPAAQQAILGHQYWARGSNSLPGIVRCRNGYVGMNVLTFPQWQRLCYLVERPDLAENPDYQVRKVWRERLGEWLPWFQAWAATRTKEEILALGQELRVPFAVVPGVDELGNLEQHRARTFFQAVEGWGLPPLDLPGSPFRSTAGAGRATGPAPALGAHTEEILGGRLGHGEDELRRWRAAGVI